MVQLHRYPVRYSKWSYRWVVVAFPLLMALGLATQTLLISPNTLWADQPNFVFILADDMGYGDVHALNPDSRIPTPHLDRLAAEGMTFTDAHTPSAVCTPTRYGFVTGRYCWRSRLKRGVLDGYGTPLIERDRPTVASFLGSQGYRCAVVGKWHLGLEFGKRPDGSLDFTKPVRHGPNDLGFDESYIIPASLDFPPYVYIHNGRVTEPSVVTQRKQSFPAYLREGPRSTALVMEDVLDHLLERAVGFIDESAAGDRPFFLYFALTAPHKPVLPHPRFRGRSSLGPYGDFIVQVDWTVGQVMKALEQSKVADETLLIFTSDNGSFMFRLNDASSEDHVDDVTIQAYRSDRHRSNFVFRGTKADIWEGGHHVPFFARWPGRVKEGSQCSETICLTDFFATVADVVDGDLPEGAAPDSYSFLPLLQTGRWSGRGAPVIHHSVSGMFAIRQGPWKLVLGNGSGGRERPSGKPFERPYQLFHLGDDLSETRDQWASRSEIAARLEEACRQIRENEAAR